MCDEHGAVTLLEQAAEKLVADLKMPNRNGHHGVIGDAGGQSFRLNAIACAVAFEAVLPQGVVN